jgi:hypothetical protein
MAEVTGETLPKEHDTGGTARYLEPAGNSVELPASGVMRKDRDNTKGDKDMIKKNSEEDELRLAFKKLQIRNRRAYAVDHGVLQDGDRQAFCAAGTPKQPSIRCEAIIHPSTAAAVNNFPQICM